jgi:hypothetical protein
MIDVTRPAPGPWRMPTDCERRCRVYFANAFRDCIDVCEVNPDLEETTDATMRLIAAAPELLDACREALRRQRDPGRAADPALIAKLTAAIARATKEPG